MSEEISGVPSRFVRALFSVGMAAVALGLLSGCNASPGSSPGPSLQQAADPDRFNTLAQAVSSSYFGDGFDSGTLLKTEIPEGEWDSNSQAGGVTLSVATTSGSYARSGVSSKVFRVVDNSTSPLAPGSQGYVQTTMTGSNVYLRYWTRIWNALPDGVSVPTATLSRVMVGSSVSLLDINVLPFRSPDAGVYVSGAGGGPDAVGNFPLGAWHLVEAAVTGIETTNGSRQLWVNGVQISSQTGLNYASYALSSLQLGIPWASNQGFRLSVDFDDFRADTEPVASRFAITPSAGSTTTSTCIPVTVSLTESITGGPATLPIQVLAPLSVTGVSGAQFYGDNGCTSGISSVSLPASTGTATAYFKSTASGTATLTAGNAATELLPASRSVTVATAATPGQLAFITPVQTFTAGTCGGTAKVITVQLQDSSGAPSPAPVGGQSFTVVSSSTGTVTWFTDPTCKTMTAPGGSYWIPGGQSTVNLYYVDTLAGAPEVTLSNASGLINPTGQVHTVDPAAASRLVFTSPARTFTAGSCGDTSNVIRVQQTDAYGNAVNASTGGTAFTALSSASSTSAWFPDPGCLTQPTGGAFVIPNGQSAVSLYYQDTLAGSPLVTLNNSAGLTNPTGQSHTVNPGALERLVYATPPRTVSAGTCSAVLTVRTEDRYGNAHPVTSALQVELYASTQETRFFSDSACTDRINEVTVAAGNSTASFYVEGTSAGDVQLTATTYLLAVEQTLTIQASAASRLVFITAPQTVMAGNCSAQVTVQTQDAYGNVAPVGSARTLTLTSSSPQNGFYSDASCNSKLGPLEVSNNGTSASFYFKDTLAGDATLRVSGQSLSEALQVEKILAGPATRLVLTGLPSTSTAGTTVNVTVSPYDFYGNPATSYTGTVSVSSSDSGSSLPPSYTFNGSQASQTLPVTFATAGTQQLVISDDSVPPLSTSPTSTAVVAGAAARLVFTTAPRTFGARQCSGTDQVITAQLQDSSGNPSMAPSGGITFTATSTSSGTVGWFAEVGCGLPVPGGQFTLPAGATQVQLHYRDTSAGKPTVGVTGLSGGLTAPPGQVHTVRSVPPSNVTTLPATRISGSNFTLQGQANPEGISAVGWFRYDSVNPGSCDDAFGTRLPSTGGTSLGAGTAAVTFSKEVTGLAEGKTYWYCALASSSDGLTKGDLVEFVTPTRPLVTTLQASAVTSKSAVLRGEANPHGDDATGWLRYDTVHPGSCNDTFGTRLPASGGEPLGAGASAVSFTQQATGLLPETTYYFCAFASNGLGAGSGAVESFFTNALVAGPPDAPSSLFWLEEGDGAVLKTFEGHVTARVKLHDVQGLVVAIGPGDVLTLEADSPLKVLGDWVLDPSNKSYTARVSLSACPEDDDSRLELRALLNGAPVGGGSFVTPQCTPAPTVATLDILSDSATNEVITGSRVPLDVALEDNREDRTQPLYLVLDASAELQLGELSWKDDGAGVSSAESGRHLLPVLEGSRTLTLTATVSGKAGAKLTARAWLETAEGVVVSEVSSESLTVVPFEIPYGCGCSQSSSGMLLGLGALALALGTRRRRTGRAPHS